MVTMETLQQMMNELYKVNAENIGAIMRQQQDSLNQIVGNVRGNSGLTDTRGIGRPVTFKGDEAKYAEWKAKLLAYLRISTPQSDDWITWTASMTTTISEEDIDLVYPDVKPEVLKFARNLYSVLLSCTEDDPFRICHSVKEGNGLEAIRLLMKRYEPRTPGTKRALLKAIINNPAAKKPDEVEKNLMKVEEYIKKYEVMSVSELPEDLKVTVLIDLCPTDLKEHLELTTREMTYKQVRDEVISYTERKRNAFSNDLKAMDVDEVDQKHNHEHEQWWGGKEDDSEQWYPKYSEELFAMGWGKGFGKKGGSYKGYSKGGYKGSKGDSYKDGGKGDYRGKGDSYKGAGTFKGDGKGKSGKGGFNGYCHWCGEWGHSQSRCRQKDEYMDNQRRQHGKGGSTDNVEEATNTLENLEKGGGPSSLCSLEHCCSHHTSNRFAALAVADEDLDEQLDLEPISPPGLTLGDFIQVKSKHKKRNASKVFKERPNLCDLDSLELNQVRESRNNHELTITIDSGASENVISESTAPQVPIRASQGSCEGVKYVTANGSTMVNRGEKRIHVRTTEGQNRLLNMQVTDVRKPLMSVARICDAGHEVVFKADGGYIKHIETGQRTAFNREDNVYRLKVAVNEPVFSRQGAQ